MYIISTSLDIEYLVYSLIKKIEIQNVNFPTFINILDY